jgi:hypothetical protein
MSPANGAVGVSIPIALVGTRVADASSFRLEIAEDSSFSSTVFDDSTVIDTMRQVKDLTINKKYYWRVNSNNSGGISPFSSVWCFTASSYTNVNEIEGTVKQNVLFQNYPDPFNPSTTIRYGLLHRSAVTLAIFNILGQQVASLVNSEQEAGYHEAQFNGITLASGVYFYRLQAGSFVQTKKLLLIR